MIFGGFPKIRGALYGVPIPMTVIFRCLYWGTLNDGSYHSGGILTDVWKSHILRLLLQRVHEFLGQLTSRAKLNMKLTGNPCRSCLHFSDALLVPLRDNCLPLLYTKGNCTDQRHLSITTGSFYSSICIATQQAPAHLHGVTLCGHVHLLTAQNKKLGHFLLRFYLPQPVQLAVSCCTALAVLYS